MTLFVKLFKTSWTVEDLEFVLISSWLLLCPQKGGWLYFLVSTAAFTLVLLRRALKARNLAINAFSLGLVLLNGSLLLATLFSPFPWKSLLYTSDILLASLFFLFWESPVVDSRKYFYLLGIIISLASAINVAVYALHPESVPVSLFFANPILQGIASGAGVILFLYLAIIRPRPFLLAPLLLNLAAMVIAGSKAALLGTALVALLLLLLYRRRWLIYALLLLGLLAIPSSPLKKATLDSFKNNAFARDRLQIWKMSARMIAHYPWTGIGPALFAENAHRFNFPQERGLSRFGKIPESPHSDYLRIVAECGVAGALLLLLMLVAVGKRFRTGPFLDPPKLLLLFFLFQSLFFNYLLEGFFLFAFLFILKVMLEEHSIFISPSLGGRILAIGLALGILLWANIFPALADSLQRKALRSPDPVKASSLLAWAERLEPANPSTPLLKGRILLDYFTAKQDLAAAADAIEAFQVAERKNPFDLRPYYLEARVFETLLGRGRSYSGQDEEIIAPLARAESYHPYNPFLKLKQAYTRLRFKKRGEAEIKARQALALEPDFIAALAFLHRNFNTLDEKTYSERLEAIHRKQGGRSFSPPPESYLGGLFTEEPNLYFPSASTLTRR